ncbi:MAG: alanyl-tRNA synthetase [Rubritalea sp.]|jgi:alanyl-tRNA synthetase
MTASEIRQSFLDFFVEKSHTIVPSGSILPQSPGLLFTNAGMNQFVPYFLGTEKPPYSPARATDTQKCVRAGGKHNDLDDVGYDTYHHTLFEMLGNWSFGDYFKEEAIGWAWELLVEHWGFPAERVYATVYSPDSSAGDPSIFDQEAYDIWAAIFIKNGLDPAVHIVNGNVEDNFWKMGDTGPCGPCSELHLDLTPKGDTKGALVNKDSDLCIELWNLVFIQYNAEADGTYRDLPQKHIDTGMGFERAVNIMQGTKNFTDFSVKPTNYATDVFTPIFKKLEELSGKTYRDIYPESVNVDKSKLSTEMKEAIAFRVIADHIRTLSLSIADGIMPGNTGRNYVLRRILRRAVNYGRTLGFMGDTCFLQELVDTLVSQFGTIFPEVKARAKNIKKTLKTEEESFNRTLARGLARFEKELTSTKDMLSGDFVFKLYDTFGFPVDLTEILCQQNGIGLDMDRFYTLMAEQKNRGDGGKEKTIVRALDISTEQSTEFLGFETDSTTATITEIHEDAYDTYIITDKSPFYVEMGGQQGDTGTLNEFPVNKVIKIGTAIAHLISKSDADGIEVGDPVTLIIDGTKRRHIESHHTATHLLHWALHEIVSEDTAQQGSLVAPDRLRFDFSSAALTPEELGAVEEKVNSVISDSGTVSWKEVPHADVKNRKDIMQFFGDKYGELVRVVQIGGEAEALDGYSMELCGGAHVTNTSEIGLFKIKSEGAIAAGVRRIEAVCGEAAWNWLHEEVAKHSSEEKELKAKLKSLHEKLESLGATISATPSFPHIMTAMLVEGNDYKQINATYCQYLSYIKELKDTTANADKALKKAQTAAAAQMADQALAELLEKCGNIVELFEGPASLLQELLNGCKKKQFTHAAVFIVDDGEKLHLGALSGADGQAAGHMAGKLIQTLTTLAGGKGGGKPDMARGAAPQREKVQEILAEATTQLNS